MLTRGLAEPPTKNPRDKTHLGMGTSGVPRTQCSTILPSLGGKWGQGRELEGQSHSRFPSARNCRNLQNPGAKQVGGQGKSARGEKLPISRCGATTAKTVTQGHTPRPPHEQRPHTRMPLKVLPAMCKDHTPKGCIEFLGTEQCVDPHQVHEFRACAKRRHNNTQRQKRASRVYTVWRSSHVPSALLL